MSEFKISKAISEDKNSILTIKRQAHEYFVRNLPHLYQSSEVLFTEDFINSYFNNSNHVVLLAKINHQIVGYALIDKVMVDLPMMKSRVYVYIQDIAVMEEYRNIGIATALLKAIEEKAEEWEAESLELAVHINNPDAVQLYNRYGFTVRTYRMEKKLSKQVNQINVPHDKNRLFN